MSIFSGLFRSRDKPTDSTTGSTYRFLFGGTTSGKAVTERSAMQMTAVYSCVRILAEAVAGLPLHLYRYKEDGGKEKAIYHPLYLLLHDEPNPEMSSFVFRETLMTHLLLWGNAYAQIIRNGKGEVIANELKAGIVDKARAQMAQTLQQDLDRLEALKAVNPNVRDSELEYLRNLQAELHHLIDQTQLKLDAIRFIVVTHN